MRAVVRIYMTQKPLKATTKSEDQATVNTSLLRNTTETQNEGSEHIPVPPRQHGPQRARRRDAGRTPVLNHGGQLARA